MANETDLIFLALNLISIVITSIVTFFFLRFFRYFRYIPLENIALGFAILVISYSFGASYQVLTLANIGQRISLLRLVNLVLQSLAFSFITAGYVLWKQEKRASWVRIILASLLIFTAIVVVLFTMVPPSFMVPDFSTMTMYFHGVNFALLAFVAVRSFRKYVKKPEVRSSMVPAAFTLLAVSQYSLLIWSIDRGLTSLILGAACRIVGFALFLHVVFTQRRSVLNE